MRKTLVTRICPQCVKPETLLKDDTDTSKAKCLRCGWRGAIKHAHIATAK